MVELRPGHRLFVAYELPPATREHLHTVAAALCADTPGLRPVPAELLHATVAFIGSLDEAAAPAVLAALFDAMQGPAISTRLGDLRARPRPHSARLVAMEYQDPGGVAAAHAARVRAAIRDCGGPDIDERFWPHVTLARARRPIHMRGFPPLDGEHVFAFDRITLYDSHITSTGPARYARVMTVPLGSHGERKLPNG